MAASLISLIYFLDAVIALTAALVIWRRRESPGAVALAVMLFAASFWAVGDAIELHVHTVRLKQLVSQVQYLGIVAAAPAYFEAAMALAGHGARLTRLMRVVVWSIPVLSVLCAWTNDAHHWLWTSITLSREDSLFATYRYGWWFWLLTAQNYVLMAAGSVAMLRGLRTVSQGFRGAMLIVVVATLLPWLGNFAYNVKLGPWPGLNWLTLSLGVSGWLLVWVVVRGGLLDLLPRVRGALVEMMTDAVLVVDRRGNIGFSNQVARDTVIPDVTGLLSGIGVTSLRNLPAEWQGELRIGQEGGERWFDIRLGPVFDRWGARAGWLIVGRDVTLQKQLEDEREQLIEELREALRRVTQLEGLLPVCAACRNVSDGDGGWTPMEKYLAAHTSVEITHGICPSCMDRLYPEFSDPAPVATKP